MLNEERNRWWCHDAFVYDDKFSFIVDPLHIIGSFYQFNDVEEGIVKEDLPTYVRKPFYHT